MAWPLLEHNSRYKIMYTCEILTIYCNSELPQDQTLMYVFGSSTLLKKTFKS